ncbi:MAG TPA: N-acetyl-gamma-glutamyl-phosphate reductase [Acidimicrobiales bacterium]|nr:N-acetyl-gamma-glutamyl-phosphate reductase [Acidimicrobiales bacterium]
MKRVGILGASGYAGVELLRLLAQHPTFEVAYAAGESAAGETVGELYPSLAAAYPDTVYEAVDVDKAASCDLVFLALPHGASSAIIPSLVDRVAGIVDLGADFRLRDPALYHRWYGEPHPAPELLDRFVHGIPELHRDEIARSRLVAAAGCYPTAAALALAPLVAAEVIEPIGVIVDAASGVSGAGKAPKTTTHFNTVDEDFTAYGLLNHRHTPEMEQAIRAQILFTPHLAPMNRGILATCYARPTAPTETSTESLLAILADAYANEPFVVVSERLPSTKATLGSNAAHVTVRFDDRTGWIVALCAIDNLGKGAAGQMVQCANIAAGLPETAGLSVAGLFP